MRFNGRFLDHMSSALQRNRNLLSEPESHLRLSITPESAPIRLPGGSENEKSLTEEERTILINRVIEENEAEVNRKTILWSLGLISTSILILALRIWAVLN